jgi:ElaB/YqjD/DUF883 family membrane-anchored ribosome-binding protein
MADDNDSRDHRTPEEIERELEDHRAEISRTIEAIQYKITPGQLAGDAYSFLGDSAGDFAKNLGNAAKNNPVPVALIGLGLAWLMMGGGTPAYLQSSPGTRRYDTGGDDSGTSFGGATGAASSYARSAGDAARSTGDYVSSAGQAVSGAVSRVGSSLRGLRQRAGETAGAMVQGAGDTASSTSARVRQMSEDVRSLASEWSENASDLAESARDQMHRATEAVQEQAMQMRDNTSQMLRDQPLIAGALGIAIGAVIGALLPLSRRENELMGETRDQLLDQATQYGQETIQQATDAAKDVASAAAEAAKDEAQKKGLMDEGDRSSGNEQPAQGSSSQQSEAQFSGTGEKWSGGSPYASRSGGTGSAEQSGSGQYSSGSKSS